MVGLKHRGDRLRVAVLMGGPSSEHEVSLQGGSNVVGACYTTPGRLISVAISDGTVGTRTDAPGP